MQLQIGVKVLIQNKEGAFLFLRRSDLMSTDSQKQSWDIPGGRINPGEPLINALLRELKEETGFSLTLKSDPHLITAQDIIVPTKDLHVVRLTYIVRENIPMITLSSEHDSYRWLTLDKVYSLNIEPYLSHVLKGIHGSLKEVSR